VIKGGAGDAWTDGLPIGQNDVKGKAVGMNEPG